MRFKAINIYKLFAVVGAAIFLADDLFSGQISAFLSINISAITQKLELWRFVSFPLAFKTLSNSLLAFFTFFFVAPKLKRELEGSILEFSLLLNLFATGLFVFLLDLNNYQYLAGVEGISAFVLVLFMLMNRKKDFRYFKAFRFTKTLLPLTIIGLWASSLILESSISNDSFSYEPLIIFVFGSVIGFVAYFIIKNEMRLYDEMNNFEPSQSSSFKSSESRMSPAFIYEPENSGLRRKTEITEKLFADDDPEANEEKLNHILDKISKNGQESLTKEELEFLDDYSKSIR